MLDGRSFFLLVLSRAFHPHPPGLDSQFLGQELEGVEFIIQSIEFPAKDILIVALFLFQCGDLEDPPFQHGGTGTAALDKKIGPLLILRDFFFDSRIELLRHFIALFGIVDDEEAVRRQGGLVFVKPIESVDEALEGVYFFHVMPWNEIIVSVSGHLRRLQGAQKAHADGLNLPAVRALLIQLEQSLRPLTESDGIHIFIGGDISVAEAQIRLVEMDRTDYIFPEQSVCNAALLGRFGKIEPLCKIAGEASSGASGPALPGTLS